MKPYCMISNAKTFAFSAENPTGARAGGSKGGDCTKLSPTVAIRAGETVTLVDTDGPGMIQSIWFTGYVGHSFVIRMYWDNCEYPSVEAPISAFFGTAYDENFVDRDGKYAVLNSAQILVAPGRGLNCYWEMPFKKHCRVTMETAAKRIRACIISSPAVTVRCLTRLDISTLPTVRSIPFRRGVPTPLSMAFREKVSSWA